MEEETTALTVEVSRQRGDEGHGHDQEEKEEVIVDGNDSAKLGGLDAQLGNLLNVWASMNQTGRRSSSESAVVSFPAVDNVSTTPSTSLRRPRSSPLHSGFKMWSNEYALEETRLQRGRDLLKRGYPLSVAMSAAIEDGDYLSEEVCSGGGGEPSLTQEASDEVALSGSEGLVYTTDGSVPLCHLFSSSSSSSSQVASYRKKKVAVLEGGGEGVGGGKRRFSWREALPIFLLLAVVMVVGMVIPPVVVELHSLLHESRDAVFLPPT